MTVQRHTIDGSAHLEARIHDLCDQTAARILGIIPRAKVDALLLGGGYGRGEGGVLRTPEGDAPYNDLEFYLLLKGSKLINEKRFHRAIHEATTELSETAGIEIEVKILSLRTLERSAPTMFYYDLMMGHRCVLGEEAILSRCGHLREASRIPKSEAARLLMNRCSGLLFAKERLDRPAFYPADADFVGRNLAKAQLGFGDAVLAAARQYHWSCLERHKRLDKAEFLQSVDWYPELLAEHEAGVEFKLHPFRATGSAEDFLEKHRRLTALGWKVWQWIEEQRLKVHFENVEEYAHPRVDKCPETLPLKNLLVNARSSGFKHLSTRYPRERLLNSLALLLWGGSTIHPRAAQQLGCRGESFQGLVRAYEELWRGFN